MTALTLDDAILALQENIQEMAAAIGCKCPEIVNVVVQETRGDVASVLVEVDVEATTGPIAVPLCVRMGDEPLNVIAARLLYARPDYTTPTLH